MVYFECYEGNKLIHTSTSLDDPEKMKEYLEKFPERTIKKINKEFFHDIQVYTSEESTYCHRCKLVGKIRVPDKDIPKLLKSPHLGCGSSPTKGIYSMIYAKAHINKILKFGQPFGQLTLLNFC